MGMYSCGSSILSRVPEANPYALALGAVRPDR